MKRLINWLFPKPAAPAGPVLRNRAGGMAWLRPSDTHGTGADTLAGRAVKTVALLPSGKWLIEPKQYFIAARAFLWGEHFYGAGDVVGVDGAADEVLEPWKEDGITDAEVRELYNPNKERANA
jgi:hypothetical protein